MTKKPISFGDAFEFTSEQCTLCGAQLEPGSYGVHIYVAHGIGRPTSDVRAYYGPSLYEMLSRRGS